MKEGWEIETEIERLKERGDSCDQVLPPARDILSVEIRAKIEALQWALEDSDAGPQRRNPEED